MADFFVWKDSELKLDSPVMDMEHKELVRKMNALHKAATENASKAQLEGLINDLANYTVKHFSDEESHMARIGFPGLSLHKVIHQQLLKQFTGHVENFKTTGVLTQNFFNFLSVWLSGHIRGIDRQYANHEHGKKAA